VIPAVDPDARWREENFLRYASENGGVHDFVVRLPPGVEVGAGTVDPGALVG
jgi:hypothetical protein